MFYNHVNQIIYYYTFIQNMNNLSTYIVEKLRINKDTVDTNPDKKISYAEKRRLKSKIENITKYWSDKSINKLNSKTDSILERFWLATLLDYCKLNSSKYDDIDHVLAYFTYKGNIALYYDRHYLGAYANSNPYPITVDFLKKFNIYYEGN